MNRIFILLFTGVFCLSAAENRCGGDIFTIVHDSIVFTHWSDWEKEKNITIINNTSQTITIDSTVLYPYSGSESMWGIWPDDIFVQEREIPGNDSLQISVTLYVPTYYNQYFVDTLVFYIEGEIATILMTYDPEFTENSGLKSFSPSPSDICFIHNGRYSFFNIGIHTKSLVTLQIFDCRGRMISDIFYGQLNQGRHQVQWNLKDKNTNHVSSGSYFSIVTLKNDNKRTQIKEIFHIFQ